MAGCEKERNPAEPSIAQPTEAEISRGAALDQPTKDKAWASFLHQIAQGQLKDPLGQYVSKDTRLDFAGDGPRPTRPKYNAQNRQATVSDNGAIAFNSDAPCSVNGEPCTGGGGSVPPTFISTEGMSPYSGPDNPNGYIYDLKLVSNSGVIPNTPTGYTRIPIDLNDQAGGDYIFLTFTRKPDDVANGIEYHQNRPYSSGPLTGIAVRTGGSRPPSPSLYYYDVLNYSDYGYLYFDALDLNNGAFGAYIWSYKSKITGTPIEIGILSGDSDLIRPPQNWERLPTDLNQSAGGKFIYLCYK
ncbi:hypothetical protein [Hymenobacter sediminicola]|uniref:MABP domain-containing protein n=1 Tax=Hymenobacter sediminicola TaxID=2761579 RepID=A0A7G7WAG6_9BACT|nr:hypothetical protein [Hymenobacter sediminicola]QNH63359.1 hypothetical protein H4317_06030 [Hymenobacter sediminicola]